MTAQSIALGLGAAGAMVDVTSYITGPEGTHYQWGRTSEFQDPRVGQFDFVLDNYDGRFTPGNTSGPYASPISEGTAACWQVGTRLVTGAIISLGFADSEDQWGRVTVTVGDPLQVANRTVVTRLSDGVAEANAWLWWPMDDPATVTSAAEKSGNGGPALDSFAATSGLLAMVMTFGVSATGPTGNQLQLAQQSALTATAATNGAFPTITYPAGSFGYWGLWVTPAAQFALVLRVSLAGGKNIKVHMSAGSAWVEVTGTGIATPTAAMTGQVGVAHYIAVGLAYSGSTLTVTLYVDGVSAASASGTVAGLTNTNMQPTFVSFDLGDGVDTGFLVDVAHLSHSPVLLREDAASTTTEASRVAAIAQACPKLTLGALDANLSSAPYAGDVTNLFTGICDVLRAEQGHAYFVTSGSLLSPSTVLNVRARTRPTAVSLTLDAALDLQGVPQFVRDVTNMFATVTASGPVTSASYEDASAVARVGSASTSENVGLVAYDDLYAYASDRMVRGENVALHPLTVTVDTLTSSVSITQLLALNPGDRVRISNLQSAVLGFTSWDGWFLGADESHNMNQDQFVLYVAPVLSSLTTFDGHLMAGGDLTLQSSITAAATSMVIVSSDGTLWDTTDTHTALIDGEAVMITAITGSNPQTATITRGILGTTAAAHNAGAAVEFNGGWATKRANLAQNPEQVSGGSTGEGLRRFSWVGSYVTQAWGPYGITTATRFTAPASPPANPGGVDFGGNGDLGSPGTTGNWILYPVTPGSSVAITASAESSTGVGFNIQYRFHDGAGNWIGVRAGGASVVSGAEASASVTVPAGAAYIVARIQLGGGAPSAGDWFEYTGIKIEVATSGAYFSGNTAPSGLTREAWTGTANASTSIQQVVVADLPNLFQF